MSFFKVSGTGKVFSKKSSDNSYQLLFSHGLSALSAKHGIAGFTSRHRRRNDSERQSIALPTKIRMQEQYPRERSTQVVWLYFPAIKLPLTALDHQYNLHTSFQHFTLLAVCLDGQAMTGLLARRLAATFGKSLLSRYIKNTTADSPLSGTNWEPQRK